jgi:hypothetical protein
MVTTFPVRVTVIRADKKLLDKKKKLAALQDALLLPLLPK